MENYRDIHRNLIGKVAEKILIKRKVKISFINKNNIILAGITLWLVFFCIIIFSLLSNSGLLSYFDGSDVTLNMLKEIISLICLSLLFSVILYGYIFFTYNLFLTYKYKKEVGINTIYYGFKGFLIFSSFIFLLMILYILFDKNMVYLNSIVSQRLYNNLIYGYLWIFGIFFIIFAIEYFIKVRKNYFDFWMLMVLTLLPPNLSYKFLTYKQKEIIVEGFSKVNNQELLDVGIYLIYGNKIENILRKTSIIVGLLYLLMKVLIGDFWIDYKRVYSLLSSSFIISIEMIVMIIISFFLFKLFFTPSFIRGSYYVYIKYKNKIDH